MLKILLHVFKHSLMYECMYVCAHTCPAYSELGNIRQTTLHKLSHYLLLGFSFALVLCDRFEVLGSDGSDFWGVTPCSVVDNSYILMF
jgi:hypothetical protein